MESSSGVRNPSPGLALRGLLCGWVFGLSCSLGYGYSDNCENTYFLRGTSILWARVRTLRNMSQAPQWGLVEIFTLRSKWRVASVHCVPGSPPPLSGTWRVMF